MNIINKQKIRILYSLIGILFSLIGFYIVSFASTYLYATLKNQELIFILSVLLYYIILYFMIFHYYPLFIKSLSRNIKKLMILFIILLFFLLPTTAIVFIDIFYINEFSQYLGHEPKFILFWTLTINFLSFITSSIIFYCALNVKFLYDSCKLIFQY